MIRNYRLVLILSMLAIAVSSFQAIAADKVKIDTHKHVTKSHSTGVYACPKCEVASMKGGKCPMCGAAMQKVNAKVGYECADCHVFSAKAGKCPTCKKAMVKAAETYACEDCKVSATKAGKYPKCKKALTKYDMKLG